MTAESDHVAAATFWARIHEAFIDNDWSEMDSSTFAEHAEACGLLEQVVYDPDAHGEIDADAGDEIYLPTDLARRLSAIALPTTDAD